MGHQTASILIVEDDAATLALFEAILKQEGYEVVTATNGDDGIEEFRRNSFDVVVTDMDLPTINGADLFYRLRMIDPEVRIILSSGHADPGLIRTMKDDGLYRFLPKPFNPKELVQAVGEAIGR